MNVPSEKEIDRAKILDWISSAQLVISRVQNASQSFKKSFRVTSFEIIKIALKQITSLSNRLHDHPGLRVCVQLIEENNNNNQKYLYIQTRLVSLTTFAFMLACVCMHELVRSFVRAS